MTYDVRNFTDTQREAMAAKVRVSHDFKLPNLSMWNYKLCRTHRNGWVEDFYDAERKQDRQRTVYDRPVPGCLQCGIHFRQHQRVGIAWLYLKKRGLLADVMGPQPLDAKVLTPTGWSTIREMVEGTEVIDPSGASSFVEQVHYKGTQPVFRLTFTDGSSTRAAGSHLWEVNTPQRKLHRNAPFIRSTQELLDSGLQDSSGNNKYFIPITQPVNFPAREVLLDPYVVGVWLGDGSSTQLSTDHEIVESLSLPPDVTVRHLPREGDVEYFGHYLLNGLNKHLRITGLTGNAYAKKIPTDYLLNSVENRVALLQGLLDTDGGSTGGYIEWGTVSPQLADDMEFIVNSLGGTFSRSSKIPTYTYKGEKRKGQLFYRFHIAFNSDIQPFRLSRKLETYKVPTKYQPTRAIVSIEPDGVEEVRCISVSAASHLYLTDEFVVTHNSGKGHGYSHPVLQPSGWTTIGELKKGDLGVGSSGLPTVVTDIYELGEEDIYTVTFSDGVATECTEGHIWAVQTPPKKHVRQGYQTLTVKQLLEKGIHSDHGIPKWYIPMVEPVELDQRGETIFDPYLLGFFLGSGADESFIGMSTDVALMKSVQQSSVGSVEHKDDFRVHDVRGALATLGMTNRTQDNFIPESYLWTSIANRIALLQGLLDADGDVSGTTGIRWGTLSSRLAEDVKFLVESLGGSVAISGKEPVYAYKGRVRTGQFLYRFSVQLPQSITPFRLLSNIDKWKPKTEYLPTRAITSIVHTGREKARCIRVSAEDSLYVVKDFVVTHNTIHAGGLVALLHETGEINTVGKVIIAPRAAALGQWQRELLRMMPSLNLVMLSGPRAKRIDQYLSPWDVLLVSPQTLNNDLELVQRFKLSALITDDVDAIRNPHTKTAYTLKKLGTAADRMVIMTGTPFQKRLPELHSTLEAVGGLQAFGPISTFERRYITSTTIRELDERTGLQTRVRTVPAYRGLAEVKRKMAPMVLRRNVEDLVDVNLPQINPNDIFLDLYPAQRNKYEELRRGVIQIMKEEGTQIKHITALSKLHYGAQICGGLATLGEADGPGTSVKMDWILSALQNELEGEKVVIFASYRNSVRALQNRFRQAGIGFETVWGEQPDKNVRMQAQERFWHDSNCQVLLGTQAIEQSLNLQISRHLINMDTILNPSRMAQLAGRIRRDGSAFKHVFVHNLLTNNSQEARYLPLLEREAALSSHIWDENNELFSALNPMLLLQLITG